ncbi:radical SAM protein [Thermodesulfobacteriota bacterium]
MDEIKEDIRTAKKIEDDIKSLSVKLGYRGEVNSPLISSIFNSSGYSTSYRSIAAWLYYGTDACFLQDADNLIMKTDDLVEVLRYLKEQFPDIKRVTTYTRSRTIAQKSLESLKKIRMAGLDRIHVGLESGYDPLLKMIKKGVTGARHIEAGKKVIEAGMELSEYVMPGLGGQEMWKEHAKVTAEVLNQINPHFIRLRSLRVPKRVPLFEKMEKGEFTMQTDDMIAEEIRLFIESLDGINSVVTSDHMMNLLEEVSGKLPEDKERMIEVIEKYQKMSSEERVVFRVGRRGGAYRSTDDIYKDPDTRQKIEGVIQEFRDEKGDEGVDQMISEMVDQYV